MLKGLLCVLMTDSSKTEVEVIMTVKSLSSFSFRQRSYSEVFTSNYDVVHILLSANAYNLNHLRLVSGEKHAKSMLRSKN